MIRPDSSRIPVPLDSDAHILVTG
ncbi:MAG: hypothetical protein JWN43_2102, partial [Gammaproteobacteria bacterium]|nr:hypothetical protein [Gammaproteobacteria bacterium]